MGLHAFRPAPPEDGSIEVIRLPTRREAVTSALDALTADGDGPETPHRFEPPRPSSGTFGF